MGSHRTLSLSNFRSRCIGFVFVAALLTAALAGDSASNTAQGAEAARPAASGEAGGDRPNFLHIMTDDQTLGSLRYMRNTKRALVRKGTNFRNYHDVQPLCCPSRASFLTGQYPHNHGVLSNDRRHGYGALDFDQTVYTALQDSGYRTGWIGKVMNPNRRGQAAEPEPGFDDWLVPIDDAERGGTDMFDYQLSDNGDLVSYSDRYQNNLFARRARDFLEGPSDEPFMLTLSIHSPHWAPCPKGSNRLKCPPQPAPADRKRFKRVRYPFGPAYRGGVA